MVKRSQSYQLPFYMSSKIGRSLARLPLKIIQLNLFQWARGVKPNRAYRPTVFNTIPKSVQFDGRSIQLEITDTQGLDEYSFFPKSYGDTEVSAYEAFVIVYAINKKDSLLVADSIKSKFILDGKS